MVRRELLANALANEPSITGHHAPTSSGPLSRVRKQPISRRSISGQNAQGICRRTSRPRGRPQGRRRVSLLDGDQRNIVRACCGRSPAGPCKTRQRAGRASSPRFRFRIARGRSAVLDAVFSLLLWHSRRNTDHASTTGHATLLCRTGGGGCRKCRLSAPRRARFQPLRGDREALVLELLCKAGSIPFLLRQRNQMNSARRCAAAEREDGGLRILVDGELASERSAGVRATCIAISSSGV